VIGLNFMIVGRTVIASEAKQSNRHLMDCFVAALLAMTSPSVGFWSKKLGLSPELARALRKSVPKQETLLRCDLREYQPLMVLNSDTTKSKNLAMS
jgi:hypothetical protein